HLQIADVVNHARVAKCGRIFAVWVDHHNVTLRGAFTNAMQDQRDTGRLAGTGRTKKCEMLAQHCIDVEPGADIVGRIYGPDLDRAATVGRVDLAKVFGRRRKNECTWYRIAGHTAAEAVNLSGQLFLAAFPHEVDIGEDAAAFPPVLALIAHAGEQPTFAGLDLDLAPDLTGQSDRWIQIVRTFVEALDVERHLRSRTGDLQHHPDRLRSIVHNAGPRGRSARRHRARLISGVEGIKSLSC